MAPGQEQVIEINAIDTNPLSGIAKQALLGQ
jgi:hypothetical protein